MAEMAPVTVAGAYQLLMVACDRPPSPQVIGGQPSEEPFLALG